MKRIVTVLAVGVAMMAANVAQIASAEGIPQNTLAAMGLSGMQQMSDEQGMEVRGEGFASVFGIGFASVLLASRLDNHSATSNIFNAVATGDSQSSVSTGVSFTILGQSVSINLNAQAVGQGFAHGR